MCLFGSLEHSIFEFVSDFEFRNADSANHPLQAYPKAGSSGPWFSTLLRSMSHQKKNDYEKSGGHGRTYSHRGGACLYCGTNKALLLV